MKQEIASKVMMKTYNIVDENGLNHIVIRPEEAERLCQEFMQGMVTDIEVLIELYEKGGRYHKRKMDDKITSPVEKNRHSYLMYTCESIVSNLKELIV